MLPDGMSPEAARQYLYRLLLDRVFVFALATAPTQQEVERAWVAAGRRLPVPGNVLPEARRQYIGGVALGFGVPPSDMYKLYKYVKN